MTQFVVLGLARDAVTHAPNNIRRLLELGAAKVCVLENDSSDGTVEAIESIDDSRIDLFSLRFGAPLFPSQRTGDRAAAMRSYRAVNRLQALQYQAQYYVVMDFDLADWSTAGLQDTFDRIGSFDVMAANGLHGVTGDVYDLWAWRENDWEPIRRQRANSVKRLRFTAGAPPYPVLSAFGGIAVYTEESFRAGNYLAYADLGHGSIHRDLWDKGYRRVFVNPAMTTVWSGPRTLNNAERNRHNGQALNSDQ